MRNVPKRQIYVVKINEPIVPNKVVPNKIVQVVPNKIVPNKIIQNKIVSNKIISKPKPKVQTPKIVRSMWIDKTKIFPCISHIKTCTSPGPKQVWVPKSV